MFNRESKGIFIQRKNKYRPLVNSAIARQTINKINKMLLLLMTLPIVQHSFQSYNRNK